jgi:hypothetical protein
VGEPPGSAAILYSRASLQVRFRRLPAGISLPPSFALVTLAPGGVRLRRRIDVIELV